MMMVTVAVVGLAFASTARAADTPAAAAAKADIQKTSGSSRSSSRAAGGGAAGRVGRDEDAAAEPEHGAAGRTKELIGLGVAAQIPCRYCIIAHTEFAKLNGASEAEIGEAVAMAALTRHWSTYLNGIQTDETKFRAEIAKIIENVKKASASKTPAAPPVNVVDGASALKEATQMLGGYVPEFIRDVPGARRAPAPGRRSATCS